MLVYKTETQLIKDRPKLKDFKHLNRKSQVNESNAFSKLNATNSPGSCLSLVNSIISSMVPTASKIVLPLT